MVLLLDLVASKHIRTFKIQEILFEDIRRVDSVNTQNIKRNRSKHRILVIQVKSNHYRRKKANRAYVPMVAYFRSNFSITGAEFLV